MHSASLYVLGIIILYFAISLKIFNCVHETSQNIIDEFFHIPQALQYCNFNFTYWNPKITTLPGLYLVSATVLKPFTDCTPYTLRFTNLIASCINLYLFYSIILKLKNKSSNFKIALQALNLSILPPLYFFSHLYYTDTLSLLSVLLFIKLYLNKSNTFTLMLCGFFSILVRQTNVVWVAFCLGQTIINVFVQSYIKSNNSAKIDKKIKRKHETYDLYNCNYDLRDIYLAFMFHFKTRLKHLINFLNVNIILEILSLILILIGFLLFVFINGSIVVGDKTAHKAAIHVPQMFYFTLFYAVFSIPYVLNNLKNVITKIYSNKLLFILTVIFCMIIVHYNTLVHPYLLADNRHYTFYIWNKFYGKYWFAKYIFVPLYVFLILSFSSNVKDSVNAGFSISFFICLFVSVALQRMIEIRYFFIPFIILKMRFDNSKLSIIVFDLIISLILNAITLKIFFTKEIIWTDFDDIQRLIW